MKMKTFFSLLVAGAVSVGLVASPNVSAQSGSTLPNSAGTVQQGSTTQPSNKEVPLSNKEVQPQQQGSATRQQGSSTQEAAAMKQAAAKQRAFELQMWNYIKAARYDQWAPAGDDGDFRESDRPHGAFVKTYMNRIAAGNTAKLRHGSVIIKENFSPDKKLAAITLMHRSKGFNPDANDWYWIKYNPDGTTAMMDSPMGKMAIGGKAKGCIECHSGADGDDYAFFND